MYITLLGDWINRGNYSEQYFMVLHRYLGRWIILEQGWNRAGAPSEVFKFWYLPFHTGSFVQQIQGGKAFVYTDFNTYLENCSVNPECVIEGTPILWWAKSCLI